MALGKPFSFLALLLSRFVLGDTVLLVLVAVDVVVVVAVVGAAAWLDVLVMELATDEDRLVDVEFVMVVADVELAAVVTVWVESSVGVDEELAVDDATETQIDWVVCLTVEETSPAKDELSVDLFGVLGAEDFDSKLIKIISLTLAKTKKKKTYQKQAWYPSR